MTPEQSDYFTLFRTDFCVLAFIVDPEEGLDTALLLALDFFLALDFLLELAFFLELPESAAFA